MKINKKLTVISIIILFVLLYCAGVINFPNRNSSADSTTNSVRTVQTQKPNDYTAEELAMAVQTGKDNKFKLLDVYKNYKITKPSTDDWIAVVTPYLSLLFSSGDAAKEYKELSSEKIDSYLNNNVLEISSAVYGDSYDLTDNISAVIKIDGQVIHPMKTSPSGKVSTTASWPESPKYSSVMEFYFDDFSSFKNKQFQFVLIKPKGEITYEVDMNNYK